MDSSKAGNVSPGIAAAQRFTKMLQEGERPNLEQLARELDGLCAAYHATPMGCAADYDVELRRTPYSERRDLVAARFSNFGCYLAISPKERPETEQPVYADAIDDLADILGDLEEVLSRLELLGIDDANWHFRNLFEIHWGRHLRNLSLYLHVQQFGGW